MGKASSRKKVARVAGTGGGRTSRRGSGAWVWPAVLGLVVALGVALVVASASSSDNTGDVPPRLSEDHWHQALGIYVCGEQLPAIPDFGDPDGIHTHADGLIHTHPFSSKVSGNRAVLGVFLKAASIKVSETSLELPQRDELENGDECPDGKKGKVQLVVRTIGDGGEGTTIAGDPNDLKLEEGQIITLAFMPAGAEIPPPPADRVGRLADIMGGGPEDLPPGQQPVVPPDGTTDTGVPADTSATTPPPATGESPTTSP
jgi:hypothetical protein